MSPSDPQQAALDRALAMLADGRRWERAGVDYREREYVRSGEAVWRDGDGYLHRTWVAHGWGDGPPDDVSENLERWDESTLRKRLGAELGLDAWEHAPRGAPSVPEEFDAGLPMPGAIACDRPVSEADLDHVIACLRRGRTFEHASTERRGTRLVWGREQLRHQPPATSPHFHRARAWASESGEEVCVRRDLWDESTVRAWLRARPDIVHSERWPKEPPQ